MMDDLFPPKETFKKATTNKKFLVHGVSFGYDLKAFLNKNTLPKNPFIPPHVLFYSKYS